MRRLLRWGTALLFAGALGGVGCTGSEKTDNREMWVRPSPGCKCAEMMGGKCKCLHCQMKPGAKCYCGEMAAGCKCGMNMAGCKCGHCTGKAGGDDGKGGCDCGK